MHNLGDISFLSAFINDCEGSVQSFAHLSRPLNASCVGGHDDDLAFDLLQVFKQYRQGQEMVNGDIEKALNLARVKIHGKYPGRPCGRDEIRHKPRRNGSAGHHLSVLPRISVVRYHYRYSVGRGPLQRITMTRQFHKVVAYRRTCRLDHEGVHASDALLYLHLNLAVAEFY